MRTAWLCLFVALAPAVSDAQITGSARTALVVVEDARTRQPVLDLGADDFVVQEGAESREVLAVRPADYPVVLMLDTACPDEDLAMLRRAAKRFIERLGSERRIAIGTLSSPTLLAGLGADRTDALTKLDELAATSPSDNSAEPAARLAAETATSAGSLFSSIVILMASPADDLAHAAAGGQPDATASIVATGAILYVIALRPPRTGATMAEWNGEEGLRALAQQSRGQFVTIYTAASYQAALDQIAARMASELLIEYLVPKQSSAKDVKVGVRLPGARVRGLGVK